MATGIYARIAAGLYGHLSALSLTPAMDISFPNDTFKPENTGYLKVQDFPASADQITLGTGGINRHIGTLQVSVFWPRGEGTIKPRERADLVASHFKRGTNMTQDGLLIQIIKPPQIAAPIIEKRFMQIPVSIRYQSDAANPS